VILDPFCIWRDGVTRVPLSWLMDRDSYNSSLQFSLWPVVAGPEAQLQHETLLGNGLTSEVFSWGRDRVLKLSFPWRTLAKVQKEFTVTQVVRAAGLPAPEAFEIVAVGDRYGIVFECVRGPSMVSQVETRPWTLFAAARQLAELHARLHALPAPAGLPSQREEIETDIENAAGFSAAEKEAVRRQLARFPEERCVCHGDFHPGNILVTARGPMIIDWSGGTRGCGLVDVAWTSVLFESAPTPPRTSLRIRMLLKLARRVLHAIYLNRYFELRPAPLEELERWRVVQRMAASRWKTMMANGRVRSSPKSTQSTLP
jgi:uncharacterized protein (TIGR02172 family)